MTDLWANDQSVEAIPKTFLNTECEDAWGGK
jgi:hypothetical protein